MKPLFLLLLSFCFAIHSFGQWTKVMLRNDVLVTDQIYDAYFINTDTGYLTTKNGVLYKTRDGGYSWTFDTVNPGGSLKRIFFATNDIGYMTVGGGNYQIIGTVLKTTDGGSTWSDVGRGNKMGFAYGLYFLNPDTGL
ncbi:MAG: hypothetical protein IPP77_05795 [Bacteroidetes bacterium]|nr:hypothetical protein [Bacteroidota bacterium]